MRSPDDDGTVHVLRLAKPAPRIAEDADPWAVRHRQDLVLGGGRPRIARANGTVETVPALASVSEALGWLASEIDAL